MREGLNGAERLLIDSETRTQGDVHYSMNYWSASPDGKHVAYGMSPSGSENAVIEILETATSTVLLDRIDRAQYAFPSWLPDGSGFFFNRLAEGGTAGTTDYYKNNVCWLHKIGTDAKNDVRVLARGQFADVAIEEIEFPIVFSQPGSNHAVAFLFAGVQNEITIYVNSLDAAASGRGGWKNVCAAVICYAQWHCTRPCRPLPIGFRDDLRLKSHLTAHPPCWTLVCTSTDAVRQRR